MAKGRVTPAALQQLLMRAVFDDGAVLEDDDSIRIPHRAETMGDH
jgi:hypothetical protein